MNSSNDHELRINAALGKIIRNFNFLELNLGLSIRCLENPKNVEQSHPMLARTGFDKKLDKFKILVENLGVIKDKEEFDNWCQDAEEARRYRNYYVHGTWDYLPLIKDKPLGFHLPPWRKETLRGESIIRMSIDELESDAQKIEDANKNLMKLRNKYRV